MSNLLIAVGIGLFFLIPTIMLIEGALRDTKDEDQSIIKLKLNLTQVIFYGMLSLFTFGCGLFIIFTIYKVAEITNWFSWAFLPLPVFFMIDLPLFVNHLFYSVRQSIYYNKIKKVLILRKNGLDYEIDFRSKDNQILIFEPRWSGYSKALPGENYGKIRISTKKGSLEISNLLMDNYDFFLKFLKNNHAISKRRQINFIS